jgi:hypothetical protein
MLKFNVKLFFITLFSSIAILATEKSMADDGSSEFFFPAAWLDHKWVNKPDGGITSFCSARTENGKYTLMRAVNWGFSEEFQCGNPRFFAEQTVNGWVEDAKYVKEDGLYSYFTGNAVSGDTKLPVNYLTLNHRENWAGWYEWWEKGGSKPTATGVYTRPLVNLTNSGSGYIRGYINHYKLLLENIDLAIVDYNDQTIQFNAAFDVKPLRTATRDQTYVIRSEPIKFHPETGGFKGYIEFGENNLAGATTWRKGYVSGYIGGDGGTNLVALYKYKHDGMSQFLMGYMPERNLLRTDRTAQNANVDYVNDNFSYTSCAKLLPADFMETIFGNISYLIDEFHKKNPDRQMLIPLIEHCYIKAAEPDSILAGLVTFEFYASEAMVTCAVTGKICPQFGGYFASAFVRSENGKELGMEYMVGTGSTNLRFCIRMDGTQVFDTCLP